MESTNSGGQWHPYESDLTIDNPVGSPQIVFADSQVGYAEGRGQLQRTVDGGLHWARIATPGTPAAGSATPPSVGLSSDCQAIDPSHKLALVRMSGDATNYVRDVTDIAHPINICAFPDLGGAPRFVTPTTLSFTTLYGLYEFDLKSGKLSAIVELAKDSGGGTIVEHDISADGSSVAYVVYNGDVAKGRLTFHMVRAGTDKVLGTLPLEFATYPRARVEFSPSGKYLALGGSYWSGAGESLPVQVRTLGGGLVFSAQGSESLTWGSGDHPVSYTHLTLPTICSV